MKKTTRVEDGMVNESVFNLLLLYNTSSFLAQLSAIFFCVAVLRYLIKFAN